MYALAGLGLLWLGGCAAGASYPTVPSSGSSSSTAGSATGSINGTVGPIGASLPNAGGQTSNTGVYPGSLGVGGVTQSGSSGIVNERGYPRLPQTPVSPEEDRFPEIRIEPETSGSPILSDPIGSVLTRDGRNRAIESILTGGGSASGSITQDRTRSEEPYFVRGIVVDSVEYELNTQSAANSGVTRQSVLVRLDEGVNVRADAWKYQEVGVGDRVELEVMERHIKDITKRKYVVNTKI